MGKARKNLGLGLVCLSFVFLFDPHLSVFDFLPDVVGYILLCVGISQLADLNYHLEEALRYWKRMVAVSAIQLVVVPILFGLVTAKERPAAFLLTIFTFSVIEVIFLVHAFREFFEGMLYLGSRMNGTAVFQFSERLVRRRERSIAREQKKIEIENEKRRKKNLLPLRPRKRRALQNQTVRLAGFTTFFLVAKSVLTVLPEFSALTEQTTDPYANFVFWYEYIALYRGFGWLILLPLGIVWLCAMLRYVRSIIRDSDFMSALTEKYVTEIEPKTHIFIQRAIKLAFAVMSVGIFFCIDLSFENHTVNVIPDFLCPIILIAALILMRKLVKIPTATYLACGAYTAISACSYYLSAAFYTKYTLSLATIRVEAYEAFRLLTVVKIVDSVVFLLMILSLFPVLSSIISAYTGFAPEGNNVHAQDKLKYVHGMLKNKVYILLAFAALCSIVGIVYILLVKTVNFIWLIDVAVCLAFSIYTVTVLNAITEEMDYKYMLV